MLSPVDRFYSHCLVSEICPVAEAAQVLVALKLPVIALPAVLIVAVPLAVAEHVGKAATIPAGMLMLKVSAFPFAVPVMVDICAPVIIPGNVIVPVTCVPVCVSDQVMPVVPDTIPLPIIVPFDAVPVPVQVPVNEVPPPG